VQVGATCTALPFFNNILSNTQMNATIAEELIKWHVSFVWYGTYIDSNCSNTCDYPFLLISNVFSRISEVHIASTISLKCEYYITQTYIPITWSNANFVGITPTCLGLKGLVVIVVVDPTPHWVLHKFIGILEISHIPLFHITSASSENLTKST
jgi:hypothetical protein